jgi:hypothetical protein
MRQSILNTILSIAVFYPFAALSARTVSPDPRILSLVSPHAQILSGMRASPSGGQTDSFLVITHNNRLDIEDFTAMSGVDSARSIHEVLFEATPDENGKLSTHSLLVSGRFNRERIYQSAVSNGATLSQYRGIDLLIVEPFLRERHELGEKRWLAIPDANVALFGTVSNVEHELDRYLSHSPVESIFLKPLARLNGEDETWSMLLASEASARTPNALKSMEPTLPDLIPLGGTLEFGIRYGSHVVFEYDVSASSEADVESTLHSLSRVLSGSTSNVSSFLASPTNRPADGSVHGVVKLSRAKYDAWLAEIAVRSNGRTASGN